MTKTKVLQHWVTELGHRIGSRKITPMPTEISTESLPSITRPQSTQIVRDLIPH